MKTKNTNLKFEKLAITELNQEQLNTVHGGYPTTLQQGSISCSFCINSSNGAGGDYFVQL